MWENRMRAKMYQTTALWLDKVNTRFVTVPRRRYRKLEEELNATITCAKLMGYEVKVMGDSDGYQIYMSKEDRKCGIMLNFIKWPKSSELLRINVSKSTDWETENLHSNMDWLGALRKARKAM